MNISPFKTLVSVFESRSRKAITALYVIPRSGWEQKKNLFGVEGEGSDKEGYFFQRLLVLYR